MNPNLVERLIRCLILIGLFVALAHFNWRWLSPKMDHGLDVWNSQVRSRTLSVSEMNDIESSLTDERFADCRRWLNTGSLGTATARVFNAESGVQYWKLVVPTATKRSASCRLSLLAHTVRDCRCS